MNFGIRAISMLVSVLCFNWAVPVFGQMPPSVPTSVDARLVLDAAGPEQRKSLSAIYLVACPVSGFGSGFLLDSGIIVTNAHVVGSCTEQNLFGISTSNEQVRFTRVIRDSDRDLALLVPTKKLSNGLKLSPSLHPEPGTEVSTWGYPFGYNGISPLLSVGYVSGYREVTDNGKTTKYIVVNGAFNHGNSGGPLMVSQKNEVIGIVVLTFHFYPPALKNAINALAAQGSGFIYTVTTPGRQPEQMSEAQITAAILNEFYEKTQVMIGEAVSGTELAAMIKEHSVELSISRSPQNSSH